MTADAWTPWGAAVSHTTLLCLCAVGCDYSGVTLSPGNQGLTPDSMAMIEATTNYAEPVEVPQLIGLRHPSLPREIEDLAGSLIRHADRPVDSLPWILSSLRVRGRPVLVLSEAVERVVKEEVDASGRVRMRSAHPVFEIRDGVLLPPLERGQRLILSCRDRRDQQIAAYVLWNSDARFMRPERFAWRADLGSGKLKAVEVRDVRCRNNRFPEGA